MRNYILNLTQRKLYFQLIIFDHVVQNILICHFNNLMYEKALFIKYFFF